MMKGIQFALGLSYGEGRPTRRTLGFHRPRRRKPAQPFRGDKDSMSLANFSCG